MQILLVLIDPWLKKKTSFFHFVKSFMVFKLSGLEFFILWKKTYSLRGHIVCLWVDVDDVTVGERGVFNGSNLELMRLTERRYFVRNVKCYHRQTNLKNT